MGAIFQFLGLLFHKWVGIITGSFLAIYTGFYSTFTHGTYLPVWAALLVGLIGFLWAAWLVWLDEKKCGDDLAQEIARLQSIIDARPLSPLEVREQLEKLYERSAQLLIDMLKWPRVDNIEETNQWYDDVKSFSRKHLGVELFDVIYHRPLSHYFINRARESMPDEMRKIESDGMVRSIADMLMIRDSLASVIQRIK